MGLGDLPGRLDSIQVRHADIHHDHVRFQLVGQGHGLPAIVGLSDHEELGMLLDDQAQTAAHQAVVVGQKHARDLHARGNSAVKMAPFPGCDST